jgi:signal transduction histidine kinase
VKRRITIRAKLALALAVPLAALAALAGVQVRDSVEATQEAGRQADLAISATGPAGVVTALQNERNLEALRVIGLDGAVDLPIKDSAAARAATEASVAQFRRTLDGLDPAAGDVYGPAIEDVSSGLTALRATVDELTPAASLDQAAEASDLFERYTALVEGLLDANARVPTEIDDATLRTGVELLDALTAQNEVEARLIREVGVASVLADERGAIEARRLTGAQETGERDVRNLAVGAYAQPVRSVLDDAERRAYVSALQATAEDPASVDFEGLLGSVPSGDAQLRVAQEAVSTTVGERAATLRAEASERRNYYIAAALGAIILAIFMLFLGGVWITRPLDRLAAEARAMATRRLPSAVDEILETPLGDDVRLPEVAEVPIRGGIEVARVADALNTVQRSAIDLAVEQAVLRRNISDSFVNLGRRNQNLLARQLEFISELEAQEEDPVRLEQLFKLDHLATRMRRNAESLLVLAGLEPPRQWVAPIDAGDVVRAALGEVEHYQRADVRVQSVLVRGSATADVSHILAELMENALAFSPPDTTVEIVGRRTNAGYMFSVIDRGVGMTDADLERANRRLAASESFTVAPSRYLGHYVVAQLAARHDVRVWLAPSPSGGVTAVVELPEAALADVTSSPVPAAAASVVEPVPAPEPAPAPESTPPVVPLAPAVPAAPFEPPAPAAVALAPGDPPTPDTHRPLPSRARSTDAIDDADEPDIAPEIAPLIAPPARAVAPTAPAEVGAGTEIAKVAEVVNVADVAERPASAIAEVPELAPESDLAIADAFEDASDPGGSDLLPHRKGRARRGGLSLPRRGHARAPAPSPPLDAPDDAARQRFELPSLPQRAGGAAAATAPPAPEPAAATSAPVTPATPTLPLRSAAPAVPLGFTGAPATPPEPDERTGDTGGENSYAFFAAFRAAADLARSDAGHDADEGAGE